MTLNISVLVSSYRLDGIDIDVEEPQKLSDIAKLIQRLRTDFGEDFIITLAPVASALMGGNDSFSGFNYSELEKNYGDEIDWYNAQFYSGFGTMEYTTDYTAIVTDCPLEPSRLVAITLTNPGNGSGFVNLDKVKKTVRQLLKKYGHLFGGVAGWEYHNSLPDQDEPWSWAAVMKLVMVNWKEVVVKPGGDEDGSDGDSNGRSDGDSNGDSDGDSDEDSDGDSGK